MKRVVSIMLVITLMGSIFFTSSFSMVAEAASNGIAGDCTWTLSDGVLTISGSGEMGDCYLLAQKWKEQHVLKVIIEEGVTSIGNSAFYACRSLISIEIPNSVTSIGTYAFYMCSDLTTIKIPESVTSIGTHAFSNCGLTSIEIPTSVTSISWSAFHNCDSLTSIEIPTSVTSIGKNAFWGCDSLTSIEIPKSVTSIGDAAFGCCYNLNDIYITDLKSWCEIQFASGIYPFDGNARKLYLNGVLLTEVEIPNSVTSIGAYAFYNCDSLTSIKIPESVTSIGENAFGSCYNLNDIYITDLKKWCEIQFASGSSVPFGARGWCGYNTKLYLNGVLLTEVEIPNSVTSIGAYAFYNCDSLTSIKIPESVTSIGEYAFCGCSSLTGIEIPKSVTSIGDSAFEDCINIKNVFYDGYESEARNITTSSVGNSYLLNATWHYYSCDKNGHLYSLNCNLTCQYCGDSQRPPKPVLKNQESGIVMLVAKEGMEYSVDGVTWQNSNVFEELTVGMIYTFYQRVKESTIAQVSETSEGLDIYIKILQDTPTAPTISSYTDTTVTLRALTNGEYSIDGITWQQNNVFENLLPATEYTFYQRYSESDTHEASEASAGTTVTTDKAKQTSIPNAPTVQNVNSSSITLVAVEGCEYSKDGSSWQISNIFSELSCGTEYTFYQRYQETTYAYAGRSSEGASFRTEKGMQTAPSRPTLSSKTYNAVTLTYVSGYEYSMDGITWKTSNIFTGLNPETNYLFYLRKAETDTHYASESSDYLVVRTEEVPECILNPLLHQYDNTCDTDCNVCGFERTIEHTYSNACDTICNICEETRTIIHNYKTTTTKATLSKNGSIVKKCAVCGKVADKSTISYPKSFKLSTTAYTYTGGKKTPSVTVKDSNGKKLVNGTDYKLTYSSSTRKSIGRYSVKITFIGKYSGSKTLYFTIGPKNPTSVKATLYGHDDVKVTWSKVSGASGYRVYYKKSTSSTWSSKTTTGTSMKLANLADGVKYDIKVVTYKTTSGYKCYNAGKSTSIYTLKKITGVKAQKSGTKVKISWTNIAGETGYQISQSTKKSGTNIVSTYKTTSGKYKTVSATKGKTYYYKVCAYKVVNGKKIYSPWSTVVKYVRK